jgi:dGTPase
MLLKQELEQIEAGRLSPYALKSQDSKGRAEDESGQDSDANSIVLRTAFQVDRDRILHSRAFRRLKGKTQVLSPLVQEDHVRDRLTHTLEVSQIAKSLARNLALNEDAAEAIAMAHDLGHPPFGHAGEQALDAFLNQFGTRFEHNQQSKRVVTLLEPLNLSLEILEGLDKHQSPYDQVDKRFVGASLEAQLVNLADEMAYLRHDLEDGIRLELFSFNTVYKKLPIFYEAKISDLSQFTKVLLLDLLQNTEKQILELNINTLADVYAYSGGSFVDFSPVLRQQVNELRRFLYQNYYLSDLVKSGSEYGQDLIQKLFAFLVAKPEFLPLNFRSEQNQLESITDYIAGMTDQYLVNVCRELEV